MNNFDESFFYTDSSTGDLKCDYMNPLLVLFHQPACSHCPAALNAFYALAREPIVRQYGISLGIANVSQKNGILVRKTARTPFPLKYVPYLLFFHGGRAVAAFTQKYNTNALEDFIKQNLGRNNSTAPRSVFGERAPPAAESQNAAPQNGASTTLGVPICDENVCYLNYDAAYDKNGASVVRAN